MQSKVSMVVPCYNKVQYIGEFFQSVYDQTWDNLEVILVNDGSTDGTRDVILEWEPCLRDRRYSVQIIDQENAGVTAAIRAGLGRVTGDYFCVPDCDDRLHPEYVLKMATILEDNQDVNRVVCDCDKRPWFLDNGNGLKRDTFSNLTKCRYDLLSASFLSRISHAFWLNMVRSNCLPLFENAFQLDYRNSQEPQSIVILGYIGKAAYLPEVLYFYRDDPVTGITTFFQNNMEKWAEHRRKCHALVNETIKGLPIEPDVRNNLLNISKLGFLFSFKRKFQFDLPDDPNLLNAHAYISNLSIPLKHAPTNIENHRWLALERSVSNYLIGCKNPFQDGCYKPNTKGRIIGYGAYGVASKELLPLVAGTPLKPDILWDRSQDTSGVLGIPVTRPDISGLTPDDTVLVFMRNRTVAAEVCDLLTASATDNILYYYDILDYLADFYFPLQLD